MKSAQQILKEHVKADWLISGDAGKAMIAAIEEYKNQFTPSASRGFAVEEIIGLKKLREYFGEHDKTTHEHYLYAVVDKLLASLPLQSKVEGEDWVSVEDGNPLPDYDVPVLWLQENGNMVVEALDKDGNPWIFEGQTFEGSYMGNKATHWRYLPAQPKQ